MLEKICVDCAECTKAKGILVCHEMFDRPIAELDECPFGIESEEIEEIEQKAKENKIKHGARGENATKSDKKPRKTVTSDEKQALFQTILTNLQENFGENVQILKENKLISVQIDEITFKVDLIQQRAPKKVPKTTTTSYTDLDILHDIVATHSIKGGWN